jgi:hypothetical protein
MSKFSAWKERLTRQSEAGKAKVELHAAPPTYPTDDSMPVEKARQKLDQLIDDFIRVAAEWNAEHAQDNDNNDDDFFIEFANSEYANSLEPLPPPPVHGMRVSTGAGKTQRFAARLGNHIRATADTRSWLYLVPTHRLGEDVAEHFRAHGLTAKVYRGRNAPDPNIPGNMECSKDEQVKMCLNFEKVKLATSCGQDITKTCCKNKEQRCEFYNTCGYQRQLRSDQPDVWIAAHNMLFHPQKKFGKIAGVAIDETFYKKGVSGIQSNGDDLTLDGITLDDCPWRYELTEILKAHPLGGLQRERFVGKVQPEQCKFFIGREWDIVDSLKLTPEMKPAELAAAKEKIPMCRRARRMVGIWGALRELLHKPEIAVSGRLVLDRNTKGQIVLRLRSVRPIVKSWQAPTAILDATLPDILILQAFYPQVVVVADIEVDMPHVRIRQVIGAPVSKLKLWGTDKKPAVGAHNLKAIRRYILARWLETERKPMLVICQKQAEEWLKNGGLPVGITVEHYNNIAGIDRYRDVRSLILIGRTIPSPEVVEAYAGALTGAEPTKAAPTGNWYDRATRGIRLANGTGIGVEADEHPDPHAEAVRWQICEAELMQALGRARGVNRTAETPLDVCILTDVVLPVTVDEVVPWQEPSPTVEMLVEGIALTSPGDMAAAWPGVWATARAAKWALEKARDVFPMDKTLSIEKTSLALLYTTAATRFRRAAAFFDPRIVPNPRAWLEERLGVLASLFHLVNKPEIEPLGAEIGLTADDRLVTVVPRETLDQLFGRAAQNPWRPWLDRKTLCGTAKATPAWVGRSRGGCIACKYSRAGATQEFICEPIERSHC